VWVMEHGCEVECMSKNNALTMNVSQRRIDSSSLTGRSLIEKLNHQQMTGEQEIQQKVFSCISFHYRN